MKNKMVKIASGIMHIFILGILQTYSHYIHLFNHKSGQYHGS